MRVEFRKSFTLNFFPHKYSALFVRFSKYKYTFHNEFYEYIQDAEFSALLIIDNSESVRLNTHNTRLILRWPSFSSNNNSRLWEKKK